MSHFSAAVEATRQRINEVNLHEEGLREGARRELQSLVDAAMLDKMEAPAKGDHGPHFNEQHAREIALSHAITRTEPTLVGGVLASAEAYLKLLRGE